MLTFCTIDLPVKDDCTEDDDELMADILDVFVASEFTPVRMEMRRTPDDGRTIRFAVEMDEDDLVEMLLGFVGYGSDWAALDRVRVLQTRHKERFDTATLWPDEHVDQWMESEGWARVSFRFSVESWVPSSLIKSILAEHVTEVLLDADLIPDKHVVGLGQDDTLSGMPEITFWISEQLAEILDADEIHDYTVADIEFLCSHDPLARWLRLLHREHVAL